MNRTGVRDIISGLGLKWVRQYQPQPIPRLESQPCGLKFRPEVTVPEMPYVLLLISLRDMPDLCPKGADLGVKPSAASCSLTLPLYLGLPAGQAESQGTLPGGVASVLVEIQTVLIAVETIERIQKVHRRLYRNNFTL